jgi:glycosyltransferase involved in cell wall biosynthesis
MKIVLIVPTKDRPHDIQNLFKSLLSQTRKPDLVIIVDGSDHPIKDIVERYSSSIAMNYLVCRPPSLPKQRNVGIQNIPEDADWVGFLDDDLVLEEDALSNLERLIKKQNDPLLKGIGLCILNQPLPKMKFMLRLFLMSGARPGMLTKAGYPTAIPTTEEDIVTEWLYGGATFWARDVFTSFKFDEWFFGTGYMEDIDFSYRVSRRHHLMVSAEAKCNHYHHQIPVSKEASIGEWQITSWWYFVSKHRDFSYGLVAWGMLGLVLKNLVAIAYYRTTPYVNRTRGHFKGLLKVLTGKALMLKGFSK